MADVPAAAAWVYLVRCRDGSLYCGWTTDPEARVAAHNRGTGAAYTRSRLPVVLVWAEPCADRGAALRREAAIKRLPRPAKLRLAHSGLAGVCSVQGGGAAGGGRPQPCLDLPPADPR